MISKKIAASTVALALGASAVVAPQATALPEEFTSPPGRTANPQQGACAVVLDQNITTVNPGVALKTTQNGVSVGVGLDEVDNAFVPWVSVSADSERVFQSGTAFIVVENVGTQDATHSYKLEALKKGSVEIKRKGNEPVEMLDVNEVALIDQESFSLKRDQKRTAVVKLAVDSNQQAQTWAWRVNNPTILAAEKTRVSPTVQIDVAPWVFETDDCAPIVASEQQSQAIIADGNEYDTGITVANAENDYQRLTGNVSIAGKKIEGAKVRVDDTGKVYVTLPKGATGSVDDDKAAKVDVEIIANPRETTKDEDFDAYKNPQVLRVATEDGVVDQDTPKFTGSVPVAKFAPAYNTPNTAKPGGSVDVALKAQPGDVRGTAVDATYTVVDAPEGWTAEPAKDGTLKVTAPKGAKHGDTATFTVDVTYADGSKDTIDTVVTVRDTDANLNTPGYGETYGKVGVEVSLEQNNKNLPEGSTFTITPGQDLGDWAPKVDPTTGTITVTIPGSAKPGDVKTILVDVTYPDGSVDKNVPAKVIVHGAPEYPKVEKTPGQNATLKPKKDDVPGGSTYEITPGSGSRGVEPADRRQDRRHHGHRAKDREGWRREDHQRHRHLPEWQDRRRAGKGHGEGSGDPAGQRHRQHHPRRQQHHHRDRCLPGPEDGGSAAERFGRMEDPGQPEDPGGLEGRGQPKHGQPDHHPASRREAGHQHHHPGGSEDTGRQDHDRRDPGQDRQRFHPERPGPEAAAESGV